MVQKWSILEYPVKGGKTNQWYRWASRAMDFDTLGPRWRAAWLPCRLHRPAWVPLGCSIGALGGFMRDSGYQNIDILVALALRKHG